MLCHFFIYNNKLTIQNIKRIVNDSYYAKKAAQKSSLLY